MRAADGEASPPSDRALRLADTLRTQLIAAMEMPDAFAALSYQMKKVDSHVERVDEGVSRVEQAVAVVQSSVAATQPEPEPWALLQGPIRALGLDGKRDEAMRLGGSDPGIAATIFNDVALALEQAGYAALATPVLIDRARALTRARDYDAAASSWTDLIVRQIESGSGFNTAEGIEALATLGADPEAPRWLAPRASALSLLDEWIGDPSLSATVVLDAAAKCAEHRDPEALQILAMATECVVALQEESALAAVSDDIVALVASPAASVAGARLAVAMADAAQPEFPSWQQLLAAASDPGCSPDVAALIYGRSGRSLYWRDEHKKSEEMFRRAMERGCVARLWEDAASWTMSAWRAASSSAELSERTFDYPKSAQALRAVGSGRLRRQAYDPHLAALEYLIAGKTNFALPELRRLLRNSANDGDVEAELIAHTLLGQAFGESGVDHALALFHYILAGRVDAAADLATALSSYVDLRRLADSPHGYSRATAFRAATTQADLIPDDRVADWATVAVGEAARGRLTLLGPQAWVEAFHLLAALADRLDAEKVQQMFVVIDKLLPRPAGTYTYADDAIVDFLGTAVVGKETLRADGAARLLMICRFSADMTMRLRRHSAAVEYCLPLMKDKLDTLATEGNSSAAELLSLYDTTPDVARQAVRAEINRGPTYSTEGNVSSMSVRVDVALAAHHARVLPHAERAELALSYLERAKDVRDSELNRAQAVAGIDALAADLDSDLRDRLFDELLEMSRQDASDIGFESTSHPFSMIQIDLGRGDLRRASVAAVCALATDDDRLVEAARSVQLLMAKMSPQDVNAVAHCCFGLARSGKRLPLDWISLATSQSEIMRQAAAALAGTHADDDLFVTGLAKDRAAKVRANLAFSCTSLASTKPTLARKLLSDLAIDVSYQVRSVAADAIRKVNQQID